MKRLVPIILLGFGVALAVVIGQRMSTDAMSVVIGVAVGVAASVPTSLLLVALLRKERATFRPDMGRDQMYPQMPPPTAQQPQVLIFDPAEYMKKTGAAYQVPMPPPEMGDPGLGGMPGLRVLGGGDAEWNGKARDW